MVINGAVLIGVTGLTLTRQDQQRLQHPAVVGAILFSRNYQHRQQLLQLTQAIRAIKPHAVIAVDHEGGRVQRFRAEFTPIPPMRSLGQYYDRAPEQAVSLAYAIGWLMATELAAVGVDFTFAPVCDLDYANNPAIGDRAFHCQADSVAILSVAVLTGLKAAGSDGVVKHFPGHGYVAVDSHLATPVDGRAWSSLEADLSPFRAHIDVGVAGIMPAHIIYPAKDAEHTAGFSKIWLDYLRHELRFDGLIISDDLDMQGAGQVGDATFRAQAAFAAGVELILCCNDSQAMDAVLTSLMPVAPDVVIINKISRLRQRLSVPFMLTEYAQYQKYDQQVQNFIRTF